MGDTIVHKGKVIWVKTDKIQGLFLDMPRNNPDEAQLSFPLSGVLDGLTVEEIFKPYLDKNISITIEKKDGKVRNIAIQEERLELEIEIQGIDTFAIAKDMFSTESLERGKTETAITEDAKIRYDGIARLLQASVGSGSETSILQILLYVGECVVIPTAVSLMSKYLYDKLKEHKASVKIGNTRLTQISEQEIYQAIMKEASKTES